MDTTRTITTTDGKRVEITTEDLLSAARSARYAARYDRMSSAGAEIVTDHIDANITGTDDRAEELREILALTVDSLADDIHETADSMRETFMTAEAIETLALSDEWDAIDYEGESLGDADNLAQALTRAAYYANRSELERFAARELECVQSEAQAELDELELEEEEAEAIAA